MPIWIWLVFFCCVGFVLVLDLFLLGGRKTKSISTKAALSWTVTWFFLALFFMVFLWVYIQHTQGVIIANQKAMEFLTGYLVEKSLSLDNIFIILMIFTFFKIPHQHQRSVLLYGILGAIVMRLLLIFGGVLLIQKFEWILYIFGAFLMITGVKMFFSSTEKKALADNPLLLFIKKKCRVTQELHGHRFLIRQHKKLYLTPLFLALIFIEVGDLIFAVDSIPAIFAITQDPFIIFTSNIFAILGLRALYFLLMNLHAKFSLLKYGLAFILVFIGLKMLVTPWIHISTTLSLIVILSTLVVVFCLNKYIPTKR